MSTGTILKLSLVAGSIVPLIGALKKIMHHPGAETWLWSGLLVWAVFLITAIYEVVRSRRIPGLEKAMWIIGFLFAGMITGIVYLAVGRQRVLPAV